MKLTFEKSEVEKMLYSALCNGALTIFHGYNVTIEPDKSNYQKYRAEGDCYEDVLLKALKNGERWYWCDDEGDESASFSLDEAVEKVNNHSTEYIENLLRLHEEEDDAYDGDVLLQLCLYGEVQFG